MLFVKLLDYYTPLGLYYNLHIYHVNVDIFL